jgi:single-strand DNA-binding protein
MFNQVTLIGNLTKDVELKYTPSGTAVGSFSIASNRTYLDSVTKEKKQETMFIECTVFGKMAETMNQYVHKGSQIFLLGRLVLDQWTDQSGQKRSKHKIVVSEVKFLGSRDSNQQTPHNNQQQNNYQQPQNNYQQQSPAQQYQSAPQNIPDIDIDEEDIPF